MKSLTQKKLDYKLPRKLKTVTIIGLGASVYDWVSRVHDEFDNDGDIWTINAGGALFRHDLLWDMHTPEWLEERNIQRALKRRQWLKNHDKPIMMPKALPEYPTSITYPLRTIIEKTRSAYFASGLAYVLAMAYCCEVDRLRLFGCDFSYQRDINTHDEQGRACCEYWVGRLIERGTRVEVTNNTHFLDMINRFQGRIYGYHEKVQFDFPLDGGPGIFVGPDYVDK
jgi:hypothetical protein